MTTTSPQSDLHRALQSWHAALARHDPTARAACHHLTRIGQARLPARENRP